MRSISELLRSGDYDAARRHPQYLNSVREGERIIAQAAADQHRAKQLCDQHNGITSMPPHLGGNVFAAWKAKQMSNSLAWTNSLVEGVGT